MSGGSRRREREPPSGEGAAVGRGGEGEAAIEAAIEVWLPPSEERFARRRVGAAVLSIKKK